MSGPIPILQESGKELAFPIVRDMDTFMYERQTGGSMEVGSYAHRPIFHSPDEIPSIAEARFSPTELPFTADDFDDQLEDALELMPEILAGAEIKYATNGLLSLTPDAMPLIGETVEVREPLVGGRDLDQGGAGHGPGGGGMDDPRVSRARSRTPPTSPASTPTPAPSTTCGPAAPSTSTRPTASSTLGSNGPRSETSGCPPFHARTEALGAFYFEAGGWELPHWYELQRRARPSEYGVEDRPHEWDRRWWSPIQNAEHLALRYWVARPGSICRGFSSHFFARLNLATSSTDAPDVDVAGGSIAVITLSDQSSGGWVQGRSHCPPFGRGALPGRHRRLRRSPGQALVPHLFPLRTGSVQMTRSHFGPLVTVIGVWGPKARDLVQSVHQVSICPMLPFPMAGRRRSTSVRSMPSCSASLTSETSATRSTFPPSRACPCGTCSARRART